MDCINAVVNFLMCLIKDQSELCKSLPVCVIVVMCAYVCVFSTFPRVLIVSLCGLSKDTRLEKQLHAFIGICVLHRLPATLKAVCACACKRLHKVITSTKARAWCVGLLHHHSKYKAGKIITV